MAMKYLLVLSFLVFLSGCVQTESKVIQNTVIEDKSETAARMNVNTGATPSPPVAVLNQDIRKVDFKNFKYTWCVEGKSANPEFTLINGSLEHKRQWLSDGDFERVIYSLNNLIYEDLNQDGQEEAILTVSGLVEPGDVDDCSYVMTKQNGKIVAVWTHNNGDREDRGMRKFSVENGSIIIEEFVHFPTGPDMGRVHPNGFNRLTYKFDNDKLSLVNSESFPNDRKDSNFLGYFHNGKQLPFRVD